MNAPAGRRPIGDLASEAMPRQVSPEAPWHTRDPAEAELVLGTGPRGLDADEAARRFHEHGPNEVPAARERPWWRVADDNFATITAAIEEGRVTFANIRKVTFFLLSTGAGQILAILGALTLGWPLPILAAQILWINLVTNGLQDVALAFEPGEPGLLERPPRRAGRVCSPAAGQWVVVLAVGSMVIAGGELDEAMNRRRNRPIG